MDQRGNQLKIFRRTPQANTWMSLVCLKFDDESHMDSTRLRNRAHETVTLLGDQ